MRRFLLSLGRVKTHSGSVQVVRAFSGRCGCGVASRPLAPMMLTGPTRQCSTSSTPLGTAESVAAASRAEENDEEEAEGGAVLREADGKLIELYESLTPLSTTEQIKGLLKEAKNAKEVRSILEHTVYRHHLCFDVLNGHGFRVTVLQALTAVAPHAHCLHEWFDCVGRFRRLGFVLTRTFVAEGLTLIRQWLTDTFASEGRSPLLVTEGTTHIRELVRWCQEDRLVFDHVLYTRMVFLLTLIVSYFDRQNVFRSSFPPEFVKRDGVVVEWVVGSERSVDYDECVLQCDALMEELLESMRRDIPSRPTFNFMFRLMDYYFATDNVEKMIAVMEDAHEYGINIAESSTAKLMQLACAFNYPNVPELFMKWRVALPQCVLATPDMSRLLFYYGRSGGGKPCPLCGEPFNHRNVSVYRWLATPTHQRECPALAMARLQKGELEEHRELPQNQDWSTVAFQLWDMSRARSIEWGQMEWRAFLLCCMFSPRALEARALMDEHFPPQRMDDFLRATYLRVLHHHLPEQAAPTLRKWQGMNLKMSPIALQECLIASMMVADSRTRQSNMNYVWQLILEKDSYIMPFTKRCAQRRLAELRGSCTSEEEALFQRIVDMMPRHVSLLDMKDSASDFVQGTTKKNVYMPPHIVSRIEERAAARNRRHASS